MERIKQMKETLIDQVSGQMSDLRNVNTHELGEVIDMIKDLDESIYYCSIVKAMEDKNEKEENAKYYPTNMVYYRDMDRPYGRMYYTNMDHNNTSTTYPITIRDKREGRSPMSRKTYMESKEMHQDKNTQMHELENYMAELSQDITEMIQLASPEEKAVLQKKLAMLSSKIV